MSGPRYFFEHGEVLFHEGEPARVSYVILSGHVALMKGAPEGLVKVDALGQGDLLGEAGLLRNGVYPVTAIAESKLEVEEIGRADFTARIAREPEMALRLVGRFARRIDALTETVVLSSRGAPHVSGRGGFVGWLKRLFSRRKPLPTQTMGLDALPPLVVAIAVLPNDEGDEQRQLIQLAFAQLPGVQVVLLPDPVEVTGDGALMTVLTQANRIARRMLERENADVLIWGLVDPPAELVELHFVGFSERDDERPGAPSLLTWLGVPLFFDAGWESLLAAITLSAIEPRTETQSRALGSLLPRLIEEGRPLGLAPPNFLGAAEQASVMSCFGNAAATLAYLTHRDADSDLALDAYRRALKVLPRDADLEWAILNRSMALVLHAMGDRNNNPDILSDAADCYRSALEGILRRDTPREWATLQYRLGEVLYKKTLLDGGDDFKECIDCLQNALQVYSRTDFPARWAEVVNLLSQVLQVYGEEVKAVSLLKRAVDLSRQVLDVRTLDTVPLGWAAAQNTLGSALFLLARTTQERSGLEEAAEAFRSSLGTYRMMGSEKGAAVAESNLRRVEDMLHKMGGPRLKLDPSWAVRPPDPPAPKEPQGEAAEKSPEKG